MEIKDKMFVNNLIDEYGKLLTSKQLKATEDYYLYDLSLSEIAEQNNISRQAIYDFIQKATKELIQYEESLGFVTKKQCILSKLNCLLHTQLNNSQQELIKEIIKILGE